MSRVAIPLFLALILAGVEPPVQLRPQPVAEYTSKAALELMLRKLASTGVFMATTAHPDDEDNALLAMLGHGQGMRTVLVTATRGEGGQNEIGPELFEALGVLRTEELLAVHRFDGAEQYFTRAVDFGYSFSIEESLERWGHDEVLGDFVRHIRAVRPDVITGFLCSGEGGGQHHQASAQLTREAFRAAADPKRYPEQLQQGLRPWQATRVFCTDISGFGPSRPQSERTADLLTVDVSRFDPVLGRTYAELGLEARSMHKCQGTSQLLLLPGQSQNRTYRLQDAVSGDRGVAPDTLFDGIDTTLPGLVRFAPAITASLRPALQGIAAHVVAATRALDANGPAAAAPPLAQGLAALRAVRASLKSGEGGEQLDEIDFRLRQKEQQFQDALLLASGVRLEALADDGVVTRGQIVNVTLYASNQAPEPVSVSSVSGPGAEPIDCRGRIDRGGAFTCKARLRIANDAPFSGPYWTLRKNAARYDFDSAVPFGVPFAPTPFTATFDLVVAGAPLRVSRPIQYRYDNILAGEKRMDLHVVPGQVATVTPDIAVVPGAARQPRSIDVTVINHCRGCPVSTSDGAELRLEVPTGWTVSPASVPINLSREDEAVTVRFSVKPGAEAPVGESTVKALLSSPRAVAARPPVAIGYSVIEYPHVRRRHVVAPAEARLKLIDVTITPGLNVGYIAGVGDQVPQAIEQLGADVEMITPDMLASADLSRYHAIVTCVRAYERRADLRANNHRLIEYARNGGTVLVQYNKFEFNEAQYGPFAAKVSSNRVTDENAPVEVLQPQHPVFNQPNRIGAEEWKGWVQERGLYFLGERDARYVDLVRLSDPFELNKGTKTGALVEARVGSGRWIYIGLGLWRQLPAGTDGAYRLMANLLSLSAAR
jgi:LmbE family N-acetylglucosaminyl deacetylase